MEKTYFTLNMNLESLDERLMRFMYLRNELVMLADEIGADVKSNILELKLGPRPQYQVGCAVGAAQSTRSASAARVES